MKIECHACGESISKNVKLCPVCTSSQNKIIFFANSLNGLGSLAISALSLIVAFIALYFSQVAAPASPKIEVQVDRFDDTGFSFFISNLGTLPTVVRDLDLKLSLVQGDGMHRVTAGFSIVPTQLQPGESRLIELEYSSFVPRYTLWKASDDYDEPFTLHFLYGAAGLGLNLHCQVDVYFASRNYPSNIEESSGSVNGTCSSAMKWYAENIGPLRADEITK